MTIQGLDVAAVATNTVKIPAAEKQGHWGHTKNNNKEYLKSCLCWLVVHEVAHEADTVAHVVEPGRVGSL